MSAEVGRDSFKNPAIATDVMVGFCGETEEEFEESYQFVKQVGFSQIHVFPYSVRKGTRAADFPDHVSSMVKEERASRMLALGESQMCIRDRVGIVTNSSMRLEMVSPLLRIFVRSPPSCWTIRGMRRCWRSPGYLHRNMK